MRHFLAWVGCFFVGRTVDVVFMGWAETLGRDFLQKEFGFCPRSSAEFHFL